MQVAHRKIHSISMADRAIFMRDVVLFLKQIGATRDSSDSCAAYAAFTFPTIMGILNIKVDRVSPNTYSVFCNFAEPSRARDLKWDGFIPNRGEYSFHTSSVEPVAIVIRRFITHMSPVIKVKDKTVENGSNDSYVNHLLYRGVERKDILEIDISDMAMPALGEGASPIPKACLPRLKHPQKRRPINKQKKRKKPRTAAQKKKEAERTKRWIEENPEKHAANQERERKRKKERQREAIRYWKRSGKRTPMQAIQAFCFQCEYGVSRKAFPNAPVACKSKKCPLFPFRYGIPELIERGTKQNNIRKGKNQQEPPATDSSAPFVLDDHREVLQNIVEVHRTQVIPPKLHFSDVEYNFNTPIGEVRILQFVEKGQGRLKVHVNGKKRSVRILEKILDGKWG